MLISVGATAASIVNDRGLASLIPIRLYRGLGQACHCAGEWRHYGAIHFVVEVLLKAIGIDSEGASKQPSRIFICFSLENHISVPSD